jgi:hypothetical protein
MTQYIDDPVSLRERLEADASPLCLEAARRIRSLERLCAMMTDTGVILEEDAAELAKADWWWVPGDGDCSYDSLEEAHRDSMLELEDLQPYEWERSHVLPTSYSVRFPDLHNANGRLVRKAHVREFENYELAEEAIVQHRLTARRAEGAL